MDGMGFLLSSLGIDPEQLKNAAAQVQTVANDFKQSFSRIERKLDFLAANTLEGEELKRYTMIGDAIETPVNGGSLNGSRVSGQG